MKDRRKTVTRCVCSNKTFDEIKQIMNMKGYNSIKEVIDKGLAGDSCGMCRPYLSNMIKTGEVAFMPGEIDPDYDELEY
jgi:NAD(P)H-nitrite reductase large subunit